MSRPIPGDYVFDKSSFLPSEIRCTAKRVCGRSLNMILCQLASIECLAETFKDGCERTMAQLAYPVYDADNHLYETADAFLRRHLPKAFAKDFYFVEVKGRTKLVIGGELSEYIPNPTFEVVAAPGTHERWYRANPDGLTLRQMTGTPLRPPPEWRSGEGRLKVMDQQGIHAALVFPTTASVIEGAA